MSEIKIIMVIEVLQGGKKQYLRGTSCLDGDAVVDNPVLATDYAGQGAKLENDLASIVVDGDDYWARSGVRSEALPMIVQFEVLCRETHRSVGRQLHRENTA
jgi:hypothetical protein